MLSAVTSTIFEQNKREASDKEPPERDEQNIIKRASRVSSIYSLNNKQEHRIPKGFSPRLVSPRKTVFVRKIPRISPRLTDEDWQAKN